MQEFLAGQMARVCIPNNVLNSRAPSSHHLQHDVFGSSGTRLRILSNDAKNLAKVCFLFAGSKKCKAIKWN